jgi:hypothetical protein
MLCAVGGCPTCVADGVRLRHWAKSAQCPVCAIADTAWATTRPNVHNQSGSGIGQWAGSRWPDENFDLGVGAGAMEGRLAVEAFSLPPRRRSCQASATLCHCSRASGSAAAAARSSQSCARFLNLVTLSMPGNCQQMSAVPSSQRKVIFKRPAASRPVSRLRGLRGRNY